MQTKEKIEKSMIYESREEKKLHLINKNTISCYFKPFI